VRVLIIEDEEALASAIARGLRREGMAVDVALDGAGASRRRWSTLTTWSCSTATAGAAR